MRKFLIERLYLFAPALFLSLTMISLFINKKKIKYFQDTPDSGQFTIPPNVYVEPKIQVDDILTVLVETIDPQPLPL